MIDLSGSEPDVKISFLGFSSINDSKETFGDRQ